MGDFSFWRSLRHKKSYEPLPLGKPQKPQWVNLDQRQGYCWCMSVLIRPGKGGWIQCPKALLIKVLSGHNPHSPILPSPSQSNPLHQTPNSALDLFLQAGLAPGTARPNVRHSLRAVTLPMGPRSTMTGRALVMIVKSAAPGNNWW